MKFPPKSAVRAIPRAYAQISSLRPWLITAGVCFLAVLFGAAVGLGGGWVAIGAGIALMLVVAGFMDFRVAVYAMMIMLPLTATQAFPRKILGVNGLNPFNLLLLVALLSYLLGRIFSRTRVAEGPTPSIKFFSPWVAVLVTGSLVGSQFVSLIPEYFRKLDPELFVTSAQYFRDVLAKPLSVIVFVYLMAAAVARTRQRWYWILAVMLGGTTLSILILAYVALSGVSVGALSSAAARSFLSPTGLHANQLGVALLPVFATSLFLMPNISGFWRRFIVLVTFFLALAALLLTFSRAAFLAMLIVGLIFAAKRRKMVWVLFVLVLLTCGVMFAPDAVKDRVVGGFDVNKIGARQAQDSLTAGRVGDIWEPLLPDVKRSLLVGGGIHSTYWSNAARKGFIYVGHPHNAYLKLILDHGIFFGGVMLVFLWRIWRQWRLLVNDERLPQSQRAFFDGICAAFVGFMVQCLTGSTFVFELSHAVYLGAIGVGLGITTALPMSTKDRRGVSTSAVMPGGNAVVTQ